MDGAVATTVVSANPSSSDAATRPRARLRGRARTQPRTRRPVSRKPALRMGSSTNRNDSSATPTVRATARAREARNCQLPTAAGHSWSTITMAGQCHR